MYHFIDTSQLQQAISSLGLDASVAVALFYFSGHGSKCQEREFMLCKDWEEGDGSPEDLDRAKSKYGVALEAVITSLNRARASIVLLDACRSYFDRGNDLSLSSGWSDRREQPRSFTADDSYHGTYRVLPRTVDTCKVLVGYSCSDGSVALDGLQRSEKSPYTTALLKVHRCDIDLRRQSSVLTLAHALPANSTEPAGDSGSVQGAKSGESRRQQIDKRQLL
jgi:Caspase domain